MKLLPHLCRLPDLCTCRLDALEPDEKCPVHGAGSYPLRCEVCGRFVKRPIYRTFRRNHDERRKELVEKYCVKTSNPERRKKFYMIDAHDWFEETLESVPEEQRIVIEMQPKEQGP